MFVRNWARNLISLTACGATAAALAYGGLTLNTNGMLRDTRASVAVARTLPTADGMQSYIVRFTDAPLAGYRGGVQGLSATNPQVEGRHTLNVASSRSAAYLRYLAGRHTDFLERAGKAVGRSLAPRFTYSYAFNGMALRLTRSEAATLEDLPGVQYVQPDRAYKPTTGVPIPGTAAYTEPSRAWIGADTVWAKTTFNTGSGSDNEGEGIVVADLDTGVNALNSSFAATGLDHYTIPNPLGGTTYLGVCNSNNGTAGQPNTYDPNFAPNCNSKLIGAYTYTKYGANPSHDPNSPEDSEGHGSHTASTAAGDFTNATSVSGISSPLSGVAPHANLIVYDVCDPTDSCANSASIAAVEQAIQDQSTIATAAGAAFKGMVMNFSIGGSADPYTDPVDQAFFSAEQAGIYVSAAGGNSGPQVNNSEGYGPVQHLAPWLATNAAATDDSVFGANTVSISGGTPPAGSPFNGLGTTAGISTATEIVYAKNHPYSVSDYNSIQSSYTTQKYSQSGQAWATPSGNPTTDAAECLFPFKAAEGIPAGAIVVCDRGTVALVDKADNVKQGGAGGVVIVSQSGNALIAESYDIPGTIVDNSDGTAIETWLGSSDNSALTATLSGSSLSTCGSSCSGIADQVAAFSSRGPNGNVYDNILKPDLAAPGVQILAAVADPCYLTATTTCSDGKQETFDFYDGTSMATPHDTGAAALLQELHGWTPMEIKSALMSTAVTGMGDQCSVAGLCTSTLSATPGPQVDGAGRLDVANAARAGFVMDEVFSGQAALLSASTDADAGTLQGFNLASLANNSCIFSCTWTRILKATQATSTLQYTVSTNESWLTVSANGGAASGSTSFSLAPGGTATLVFTATMSSSNWNQWLSAEVDFNSSSTEDDTLTAPAQHFPVAVYNQEPEPQMSASPGALSATLSSGAAAQTQTLTIKNKGQATLKWTLSNVAGATTTSAAATGSVANPRTQGSTATGPVVTRLPDSSFGYPSSFFTKDGHGLYVADTFQMAVSGSITEIDTRGFVLNGSAAGTLADATAISWYVYADSNGVPAGNPDDGRSDALWSFTTAPSATNASDGNDITLGLASAGAPALNLPAGSYWLVVAATFDDNCSFSGGNLVSGGCGGEAWYWMESAPGSGKGSYVDPGNLTQSGGESWTLVGPDTFTSKTATGSVSLAFTLDGTLNCSGSSIQGVSVSPKSGSIAPGSSGSVTVSFNPKGLSSGTYGGAACIQGNDPNTPFLAVPITENVNGGSSGGGSSGGGGGGGGTFGLAGLLALAGVAALRRRRA
ncbi:MAG TPA: S8 family serine peptidase [Gammaproteobacteria bacterium]|nr:S8 family serine peptidase [Gammaproteobacteria bacterium]